MTAKPTYSYILKIVAISLLTLVSTALPTMAQSPKTKSTTDESKKMMAEQKTDSIAFLRSVAVSVDVIGAIQHAVSDYGQYEAQLRINMKDKYFAVFELGYGMADANDPTTKLAYKTSAPYGRIGMDFNIARNKHDDYRIYVGARYAMTYYKFDVRGDGLKDPVWGDDVDFKQNGVKAHYHWMEGVFGVDAKIAGPLRLGWTLRYRRRLAHNDGSMGGTWYVPGYGKQGGSRLGGTFNVTFEI